MNFKFTFSKKVKQAVDFDRQILVLQGIKAQTSLNMRQKCILNFNQCLSCALVLQGQLYSFIQAFCLHKTLEEITDKAWQLVRANIWVHLVEQL